jgi:flagellar biosynthesis/type III secretory pathway M-ring protein FliF/YscJ
MDFLKSQFDRIQQQLNGLSSTQKMLTAALVTIMVMTLVWWGRYAGQSELEAVLDLPFDEANLTRIVAQLDGLHIDHKVTADRKLLVPPDKKIEVLANLGYNDFLPKNAGDAFDEVVKQLSPWDGQSRQDQMFNHSKNITLSSIISRFPDVSSATVMINPKAERRIGQDIEPTAFVNIQMKRDMKASKKIVNGAANLVLASQPGLSMRHVRVVVDGVTQRLHDASDEPGDAETIHELEQAYEAEVTRKVESLFADISGVIVAAFVKVNNTTQTRTTFTPNKQSTIEADSEITSKNMESSAPAPAPGEGGTVPNTGGNINVAASGGSDKTLSENSETVKKQIIVGHDTKTISTPPGQRDLFTVSVRIPRGYFVSVAKVNTGGKEPDAAAINAAIDSERTRLTQSVMKGNGISSTDDVSIEPYYEMMPMVAAAPATATAGTFSIALGGHTKEIVLGALALVSLFMVSTMVRKGTPVPVMAAAPAAPSGPTPVLEAGEAVAGEASDGNSLLDGMELDDDAVQTQQMLSQVSTMVEENPDGAANLVKRWLNRN